METKTWPARMLKTGSDTSNDTGVFQALVSTYDVDTYRDQVMPGAFKASIEEHSKSGKTLPVVFAHMSHDIRHWIGVISKAEEREGKGLWVEGQLFVDTPEGERVLRLMKAKALTQFSFAYDVLDSGEVTVGGKTITQLKQLKIYEAGPCLVGVNQSTQLLDAKTHQMLAELKAGRVLSSRNEAALRSAHASIGEVLAALESEDGKTRTCEEAPAHGSVSLGLPSGLELERLILDCMT